MTLTKQQILAVPPRLKEVEVPEWGGSVFIRPLTIHERARLADLGTKNESGSVVDRIKNCTMRLVQWSVCDEEGRPLFESSDLEPVMAKAVSASCACRTRSWHFRGWPRSRGRSWRKNC
jgi:hypothetical protein